MRKRTAESTRGEENRKMQIASPSQRKRGLERKVTVTSSQAPKELKAMRFKKKCFGLSLHFRTSQGPASTFLL